jgi:hypothetical protein
MQPLPVHLVVRLVAHLKFLLLVVSCDVCFVGLVDDVMMLGKRFHPFLNLLITFYFIDGTVSRRRGVVSLFFLAPQKCVCGVCTCYMCVVTSVHVCLSAPKVVFGGVGGGGAGGVDVPLCGLAEQDH